LVQYRPIATWKAVLLPLPWIPRLRAPPLGLALQGGGAHGAFTWGVLDALLEDGRFPIAAISGTSAGAMNSIALAQGLMEGGRDGGHEAAREGARASLQRFWSAAGQRVPYDWFTVGQPDRPGLAPAARLFMHWAKSLSPYQLNPLGVNPLRDVLLEQIDFERLRAHCPIQLFIAATHANTGRLRLFGNSELSVDALLASACLPTMSQAVVIDGEPYWDGGYSANPALFPLVRSGVPDLLIVSLNPLRYEAAPVTADEIRARALEFAFNAGFLREAVLLAESCTEARRSLWSFGAAQRRLRRLRTHLIDADDHLADLPSETRLIAHLPFLEHLRDRGRARAQQWLQTHGAQVGHESSADLEQLFAAPSA
jgi:NTE family protein